ncbi:hypothetical protein LguiA_018109 [Lonicera macranthoides]
MSQRYDLELRCRDDVKWNIPPGKGALLLFDILVLKTSKTKIRTTEGQIIALGDDEITSPPVRARVAIYSNALAIPSVSERYVLNELSNLDIDAFSRDYLVKAIVTCAVDIISTRTKGKDNDTTTGFKVDGKLKVTGEEVIDETRVLGGMKKEVFEGGDGELSCAVCLEELSGGSECTRTPCSHLFHPGCIVRWLIKKKSCPICRRVLRDDHKEFTTCRVN